MNQPDPHLKRTEFGLNRTGLGASPIDAAHMLKLAERMCAVVGPPGNEVAEFRREIAEDAGPIGTMPLPSTIKGIAKAAVSALKGERPMMLIDKLAERLAFERSGSRLYEAVLTKYDAHGSWPGGPARSELLAIHDGEVRHATLLKGALETLGADPTAVTPCADLVGVESMGLVQVVNDPRTSLSQCLHAALTAELVDGEGWSQLIDLMAGHDQPDMLGRFHAAQLEESQHLILVRGWLKHHAAHGGDFALRSAP